MDPRLRRIIRSFAASVAVAVFATLPGCGDDTPVSPGGGGGGGNNTPPGTVTTSVQTLDYGIVCFGSDKTMSVTISAEADNDDDVSGTVSLSPSSSYNIVSGGGDYTLAPGASRIVTVRYNPQALFRTHETTLSTGINDVTVTCTGYSSERPWLRLEPYNASTVAASYNYKPFSGNAVKPVKHTNVSYEQAGWQQCRSKAWVCNGNSVTESTLGAILTVPTGTTRVTVTVMMEVEDTCTQFMVEIDGDENRWEGYSGTCRERVYTLPITPGEHEIRVGTDQSSLCSGDLAMWSVKFEFNRPCITPAEKY